MPLEDFFWTEVEGKRIFYSLDTFFQANLSILPALIRRIRESDVLNSQTVFFDLYAGVGLFGITFADQVKDVILLEENIHAVRCARYNADYNHLKNVNIAAGQVEENFSEFLRRSASGNSTAMVDPPRAGLSPSVRDMLCDAAGRLEALIYLSCHPGTLMRDLDDLISSGWRIQKVIPFDFFPRTRHLETLVVLKKQNQD